MLDPSNEMIMSRTFVHRSLQHPRRILARRRRPEFPGGSDASGLTVLYDGACPLCSREIAWYRRQAAGEDIRWLDLSRCDEVQLPPGIPRQAALARFHVIEANGDPVTGAAAFARLWRAYPGLRGLAWFARLPGVSSLLELGYRGFLRLRPHLGRRLPPPGHSPSDRP
jgi:predicted DCC family thiol-disulfide oxidoreductase YuxK